MTQTAALSPMETHEELEKWFSAKNCGSVAFRPEHVPRREASDDYEVVYEAHFESTLLAQARIEVWLTSEGRIAVGVETRERIARRLGVRTSRSGFAAGHEPNNASLRGLLDLLELCSTGKIAVIARSGLFGLGKTTAALPKPFLETLSMVGYGYLGWLRPLEEVSPTRNLKVLTFEPWT